MIDFVQLWVDSNDNEWKKDFLKYKCNNQGDSREIRFRDWGNLKYWFRGVEKFTPWVNKVHFVTCGHYPDWLNFDCPKLHFVKHNEFIPHSYLPTFNVNTIELNLHRIEGLAENFVYFNDDLFIINKLNPERFFYKDNVRDMAVLNPVEADALGHIALNDLEMINKYFSLHNVVRSNLGKWFNIKYGINNFRTLSLLSWNRFSGIQNPHFPNAFKKAVFNNIWKKEYDLLDATCKCKFREISNVNQYLMRYWQLVSGMFMPINLMNDSQYFSVSDNNFKNISRCINEAKKSIICINDGEISNFDDIKENINNTLDTILPDKSSFEK